MSKDLWDIRASMRIALIIDQIAHELAGTENQMVKLISGLAEKHEINLISFRSGHWLESRAPGLGCQVNIFEIDNFKRLYSYRNFVRLISHLRNMKPDIVHTFFPVANIVGVLGAHLGGIRNIVASRRDYGEWMSRRYLWATHFANIYVTRIVTNSSRVKLLTEEVERFPGDRIEVIHNGIAIDTLCKGVPNLALKRELHIPEGNRVVGLVANYRPMKRHETFIRAAKEIIRQHDDIDFLLVGTDVGVSGLREGLQRLVESLGITRRVHFVHANGNVRDFLSILDIGVNCSEGEGLSNAIMEYMAAEVPCVVSNSGGNPDLISDNVNGYTFALGDYHALAERILCLINDQSTGQRFTRNAKEKVRNEMSLEAMISQFEKFYQGLVDDNSRAAKLPN